LSDKFEQMWEDQVSFMKLLQEKRNWPEFPVDLSSKTGQKFLDEIMFHMMKELFESSQHLRNGKSHRITEFPEVDRELFKEELCDALHLFIEFCAVAGISADELFKKYMEKGAVNRERIMGSY